MKSKWISIRRLKIHEFHRTIRYVRGSGKSWHDIFLRLGEIQQDSTNKLLKTLSTIVFIYLLLQSLGKGILVTFTFSGVTASIPIAYVTAVGAIFLFVACQQLQSVAMIMGIRNRESIRPRLNGFSGNMYGFYNGQDELALSVPVVVNGFMIERFPLSMLLAWSSLVVYFSLLLPLLAFSAYLMSWQFHLLSSKGVPSIEFAAAVVGLFVVVQSYLYLVFFNIPFPMKKDVFSIRWGFLSTLYPLGKHPRISAWIDKPK